MLKTKQIRGNRTNIQQEHLWDHVHVHMAILSMEMPQETQKQMMCQSVNKRTEQTNPCQWYHDQLMMVSHHHKIRSHNVHGEWILAPKVYNQNIDSFTEMGK
eukprot:936995_1